MRILVLAAAAALVAGGAGAAERVNGYIKKDGTYVAPHYRTQANGTVLDNYSTKPNVNPYTGKQGAKPATPTYGVTSAYKPYTAPKPAPAYKPYVYKPSKSY